MRRRPPPEPNQAAWPGCPSRPLSGELKGGQLSLRRLKGLEIASERGFDPLGRLTERRSGCEDPQCGDGRGMAVDLERDVLVLELCLERAFEQLCPLAVSGIEPRRQRDTR